MKHLSLYVLILSLLFTACGKKEEPSIQTAIQQDPQVLEMLSDSLLQNMISEALIERTSFSTEFTNRITRRIMESAVANRIELSEIVPEEQVYNGNYVKQTYKLRFSSEYRELLNFVKDLENSTILGKIESFTLNQGEEKPVTAGIDFSIFRIVNKKVVNTAELKHLSYDIKSEQVRAKRIGIFCELYAQNYHWSDLLNWLGKSLQENVSLNSLEYKDAKMIIEFRSISDEHSNNYSLIYKVIDEIQKLPDSKLFFDGIVFEGSKKDPDSDNVTFFTVSAAEKEKVIVTRKLYKALKSIKNCMKHQPVVIDSILNNPFNFVSIAKEDQAPVLINQEEAGFRISSTMKNSSGKYFAMITVGDKKELMSVGEHVYEYTITGISREEVNLEDEKGNKFILQVAGIIKKTPEEIQEKTIEERKKAKNDEKYGDY